MDNFKFQIISDKIELIPSIMHILMYNMKYVYGYAVDTSHKELVIYWADSDKNSYCKFPVRMNESDITNFITSYIKNSKVDNKFDDEINMGFSIYYSGRMMTNNKESDDYKELCRISIVPAIYSK